MNKGGRAYLLKSTAFISDNDANEFDIKSVDRPYACQDSYPDC